MRHRPEAEGTRAYTFAVNKKKNALHTGVTLTPQMRRLKTQETQK